MACSSCGGVSASSAQVRKIVRLQEEPIQPCNYTQEMLSSWLIYFQCVKTNNLYSFFNITSAKVNSIIGTIKSAINYSTNPCYFKIKLDEIQPIELVIQNSGKC